MFKIFYQNKINLDILIIDNNFYINDNYFKYIINNNNICYYSRIHIFNFLNEHLLNLPNKDIFINENIDYIKLKHKYIQYNCEIIKILDLSQFQNNNLIKTIYTIIENNTSNEIIYKISKYNLPTIKYYKFLLNNINFNFINYKNDLYRIKKEYDRKLNLVLNTCYNLQ